MTIRIRPRKLDHDDLMTYLAGEVAALQSQAVRLQNAGMGYGPVVIPQRFAGLVGEGVATLLGRPIIAGPVERARFVAV